MKSVFIVTLVALIATTRAQAITIPTVAVGNPGNAPDAIPPDNINTTTQFGAVAYAYRIGTYEVTNAQYAAFLNEKAKSDPLELYGVNAPNNVRNGIVRSGVSGSFSYTPKPHMADKPAIADWYDAIRFTNWLHNGQGSGDTESGAYTLQGGTPVPSHIDEIQRNPDATWFLPNEDEWHKAAYYQPAALGGDSDDYWLYPTGSNSSPTSAMANDFGETTNAGPNVVNYYFNADWNNLNGNVTTVGSAGPLSASFYGTFDQGGNAWEWTESRWGNNRVMRGGAWNTVGSSNFMASHRGTSSPTNTDIGFRVASIGTIPEPSTYLLGVFALLGLFTFRRRCK